MKKLLAPVPAVEHFSLETSIIYSNLGEGKLQMDGWTELVL